MEVKNIGEFASYCQEHAHNADLPVVMEFADRWTGLSVSMARNWGGHGEKMEEWIDDAYRDLAKSNEPLTSSQLLMTRDVLTHFWEHGEAFDKWFKSKVIVAQA